MGEVADDPRPHGSPPDAAPAVASPRCRVVTVPSFARWWTWPILVTVLFLILQPLLGTGWALFSDSYRYAKQAELYLGETPEQAHRMALDAYCESVSLYRTWNGAWIELHDTPAVHQRRLDKCYNTYGPRGGDITSTDPRYQSIFTTRPGYPLLAAPFIAAFGIADGMRILGFVIACAGGIATYAMLRIGGLRATAAAIGQGVYLASPLGWWALQALGEGLVNLTIVGAVAGILQMRRGRLRSGAAAVAVSWLALAVVRFSSLLLVAAAMAAACLILALWHDRRSAAQRRGTLVAAGICAGASIATALAMPVLGLPGASVTLQDTFTRHFADPLVPNPWYRLLALNYHFWPAWITTPSASWLLLAGAIVGMGALVAWRRDLAALAAALFGAGFAQVAAHPLHQEAERLGLLMWMPAVIGLAVAVQAITRRWRAEVTLSVAEPTAAPSAGPACGVTIDSADDVARGGAGHG